MRTYNKAGSVELAQLELVKYDSDWTLVKRLNIQPQLNNLSLYEDLTKPTLYAEFFMRDGVDLLKNFPIVGDEVIEITYRTPGTTDFVRLGLSVIGIVDLQEQLGQNIQTYTIRAVSHQHNKNTQKTVMESFSGKVSTFVEKILKNYLDVDLPRPFKRSVSTEETRNDTVITVPRLPPLAAIDFLRYRAVSKANPNSHYLFFENKDGFNFITVDSLIKIGRINTNLPVYKLATSTNLPDQKQFSYDLQEMYTIEVYEVVARYDTFKKLSEGAIKNQVATFDITSKSFTRKEFDVKTSAPITTDPNGKTSIAPSLVKKFNDAGRQMFVPTSIDIGTAIPETLGSKEILAAVFADIVVRILVPGDSSMTVGKIIGIDIPDFDSDTQRQSARYISGNFLVTKLRHIMAGDEHKMALECVKLGTK